MTLYSPPLTLIAAPLPMSTSVIVFEIATVATGTSMRGANPFGSLSLNTLVPPLPPKLAATQLGEQEVLA